MSDTDPTTPIPPAGSNSRPNREADATDVLFPNATASYPPSAYPSDGNEPERLRPRFGTIFWGVLLLVFAAFMVTNAIVPFVLDPSTWIIAGLVAGGVVLVIAGIAAAVRRAD
ncbi:hypothetical protein ACLRGF_07745 [Mycetocola zhadangensis]|jgi:hypothetical protein|uniref:hypothetical protein n=1 Tax=Mycetocola zhadangensis TaxID=1164595 RepID=UPI003A4DE32F